MTQRQPNASPMLFLGGILIGTLITALFTPKSGVQMRQHIKAKRARWAENIKSNADDIKQKADDVKDQATEKLKNPNKEKPSEPPLPPSGV